MPLVVVTGPPCSGKSTYTRTHAKPGDITIDYDTLAQALGSSVSHTHPDSIRVVTLAARRAALSAAIGQHHQGATVWVVDAQPSPRRLYQYQAAGARIVTMDHTNTAELHARAHTQGRPRFAHELIDTFTPPPGAELAETTHAQPGDW